MSDVNGKRCDNCDIVKFDLAGWWYIGISKKGSISLYPIQSEAYEAISQSLDTVHIEKHDVCGQQCLVAKVGKIVANLGSENISRNIDTNRQQTAILDIPER